MSKENIEQLKKALKDMSIKELDEFLAAQSELDGKLDERLQEARSYKEFLEEEKNKKTE